MKNLTAVVRDNGSLKSLKYDDYTTKKDFIYDLRQNGYIVLVVLTDDEIETAKDIYHEDYLQLAIRLDKRDKDLVDFIRQCL